MVQNLGAVGFVARNVALNLQATGQVHLLPVRIPMELPPIGCIRLQGQIANPALTSLLEALRKTAIAWPAG